LVAFVGESRSEDADSGDDAADPAGSGTPRPGLCYEIGTVTAAGARSAGETQPLTACGLPADRRPAAPSVLYQSESSNVTVQLYPIPVLQRIAPFVIKFEGTLHSRPVRSLFRSVCDTAGIVCGRVYVTVRCPSV